jgi:hypothetical protein
MRIPSHASWWVISTLKCLILLKLHLKLLNFQNQKQILKKTSSWWGGISPPCQIHAGGKFPPIPPLYETLTLEMTCESYHKCSYNHMFNYLRTDGDLSPRAGHRNWPKI